MHAGLFVEAGRFVKAGRLAASVGFGKRLRRHSPQPFSLHKGLLFLMQELLSSLTVRLFSWPCALKMIKKQNPRVIFMTSHAVADELYTEEFAIIRDAYRVGEGNSTVRAECERQVHSVHTHVI